MTSWKLSEIVNKLEERISSYFSPLTESLKDAVQKTWPFSKKRLYQAVCLFDALLIAFVIMMAAPAASQTVRPLISPILPLQPLTENKQGHEIFGFAPHWTIDRLDNVDFQTLTTLAYFGAEVNSDGSIAKDDQGYIVFKSKKATELFKKAHAHGTKVVLTLTQMNNAPIRAIMDSPEAQQRLITEAVTEVEKRGIDGINVDFEYMGDPGQDYRDKFTKFMADLTAEMKRHNPNASLSVSVYASAIKEPKIYDIAKLGQQDIKVFMMAYDFAVAGSDNAIPTSPLYGHQSGKYWYDVSTAVDDFLQAMPANKLILGVPWYGYNYMVYEPKVKAETRPRNSWRGTSRAQTYSIVKDDIHQSMEGIDEFIQGWDEDGKVGYYAYHVTSSDTWRMVFLDDARSLNEKYDFAKSRNLAGVGMWALGFDDGKTELWSQLKEEFGVKLADHSLVQRAIAAEESY